MRPMISITRMSNGDAVTLNEKVQAAVGNAVEELGEAVVKAAVMAAAAELNEVTEPLRNAEEMSFEERRAVDTAADRCLGSIHDTCEARITALDQKVVPVEMVEIEEVESARQVLEVLFPEGKGFLIGRWSEQYGTTEMILAEAKEEPMPANIARLGLGASFRLLARIHELYGERMGYTVTMPEDNESPLAKWHDALEGYLAAVIFAQRQNEALKERLLEPYETTAAAVRKARKKPRTRSAATETNAMTPTDQSA